MEIKIDSNNFRIHGDRNKELIKKSLKECGSGRSILIDNENEIIAGNGVFEQAQKLNIPIKVIETDGTELVAIKRTDLSTQDEKRKKLAVMDNSTSDNSEFDIDLLKDNFDISVLNDMGVDIPEVDDNDITYDEKEQSYSITYEICFNNEDEQDQWYRFLKSLKDKYPDIETISERILAVTNDWISKNA